MSDPLSRGDAAYRASLRRHTLDRLRYADGGAAGGDGTITLNPDRVDALTHPPLKLNLNRITTQDKTGQFGNLNYQPNQPLEQPLPGTDPMNAEISNYTPSLWERIAAPVREGQIGRALGLSTETAQSRAEDPSQPLLRFEAALPPNQHGALRGAAEFATGMTTPENVLMTAGSGGLGMLEGALGKQWLSRMAAAGFGAGSFYQAYKQVPEFADAMNRQDWPMVRELATKMVTEGGMGALGLHQSGLGSTVAENLPKLAQAPGAIQDLINQLDYSGNPERGSFSNAPRVQNAAGRNVRGTMGGAKGKTYIPLPDDVATLAQQIRPDDPNAGMRQATSVLKWQNWDKPAAEAAYGPLIRTPSTGSRLMRLRNTPAPIQERIQRAQSLFSQPTDPWTPTDYGIFDRSLIQQSMNGFPDVEQTPFPRPQPTRADLSYVDEIYQDPVNRALIKRAITRGLPLGGETFYPSLYPIKAEAIARNLTSDAFPQAGGDLFDNWIHSVAPGSARNSIYNERAVGNFLRNMTARGIPLTAENVTREMAAFQQRWGQGLPLFDTHRIGAARVLEQGISPVDAMRQGLIDEYFKIPTYSANLTGNFAHSWTGDVHEATGETLASRYHPYFVEQGGFGGIEYGRAEQHMRNIAAEMSLPTGTAQAGRWFGGGELTGLMSPRGDALDLYERQAAYTLHAMGQPTDPVTVRNYIMKLMQEGGDLLPWAKKNEEMPDHRQMR